MGGDEKEPTRYVLVDSIKVGLGDRRGRVDQEWLKTLHGSYVTRYQQDLDRTWSTATWLVALAWTLFPAAVAFNQRLSPGVVVIYGAASVALVLLWLAIASAHRAWAARSYDIVRAIERVVLGADADGAIRNELKREHNTPWLLGGDPMWHLRWIILVLTVVGWVLLWFAVAFEWFPLA